MAYIGKSPTGTGVRSRFYYTQTSGGGTSISGTDDNSKTLTFTDGEYIDVYLNGVLLVAGTDYNTNTANTISGLAALANGDVVEVVVYDIFTVADTVSASQGGTFQSNVVFNGTADVNGNELILDADGDTSITADTDDQIDFKTGGSDRMHIMSDGKVGIGDTPGDGRLHVKTSAVNSSVDNVADEFVIENNGASGMTILSANNDSGFILFGDNDYNAPAGIRYEHANDAFSFRTNSSWDRMRITSGGLLCIARTSGGGRVNVQANTNNFFVELYNQSGSSVGSITTNGSSTAYNTSSDYRLKEAVVDMTGAIDRVKALAPKRFNFIADADTTVDGFLAHEAQAVVPEAVSGSHDEVDDDGNAVYQGIDQSKLVPLLTGALKEAIAKIETLETKVAALEAAE